MFTLCGRCGERSQLQLWLQLSCNSGLAHYCTKQTCLIRAIVHVTVAAIIQANNHIDQRNDVTLGMWKTLKLIETVIKYPVLWQMDHKGTAGCRTLLSIGCGKGNFAEWGKLSRGNLWKIRCGFFAVEWRVNVQNGSVRNVTEMNIY